jgi:NAD(P)-dependent dehydrogenase (short-subunit alcohol dehydrogenase family)
MQDFTGRTAVMAGGASGIGLAGARRLGAEDMNLALADIEAPVLAQVVAETVRGRTEALLAGRVPYDWIDSPPP